jgi:hypothetical protein
MKTKQEPTISTGLAVHTALKAGESCGCESGSNGSYQCHVGNDNTRVNNYYAVLAWRDEYCPDMEPPDTMPS